MKKDKDKTVDKKIKVSDIFKYIKYTYKYSKGGKKYLFLFLIANIIGAVFSIIVPILNAQEIVKLTSSLWNQLLVFIITIFAIDIIWIVDNWLYRYTWNNYFFKVKKNLQLELSKETLKITQDNLNNNTSGIFIERINNDTDDVSNIFVDIIDYTSEIVSATGVLISVFFINKIIFILYLVFLIAIFFVNKCGANNIIAKKKVYSKAKEVSNGFSSELVRGAKDIKILNAEDSFLKKSESILDDIKNKGLIFQLTRAKYRLIGGSLREISDFSILIAMLIFLYLGKLEIASALIINNYKWKILSISDNLSGLLESVNKFNLSASRIFGILEENEFEKETFGTKNVKLLKGNIKFDKVEFGYVNDTKILNKMSFNIDANKTVAFVGKSGAGKSTIFNLISALYKVNDGNIYLDEYDINDLNKDSIRGNLSIISQNPYIYNMSIKDNFKIIKSNCTQKEIEEACKSACLHDYIITLKDGYDTIVGEGGVTLSGGQKQRLAIARALLLKTPIILFDEATSALDNETQSKINKAIKNMKGDYTVLIIAHRLSTVIDADKIFVIDNGKVVDSGTHKELLKNSKTYKRLYDTEIEKED